MLPTTKLASQPSSDLSSRNFNISVCQVRNHQHHRHQSKNQEIPQAAGNTASHLFQTGFSGLAVFSLTGDDDLHVKVSPDGITWQEAIVVDKDTGEVTFPNSTIGGGGSMFTTPVVIDTADQHVITHDSSDHASDDGYNFRPCYGAGTWSNGPVGNNPHLANIWAWGLSISGTSGRAGSSKPRCA